MIHQQLNLLECTLRDGSYAVDFKFTTQDTELLVKLLSSVGFKWIEVGHGMGLGASDAGKGSMPSSDLEILSAAVEVAGDSRVGMFFIPGIASPEMLSQAASQGMGFVRIGIDSPESQKALPFIEEAARVGLVPMMNFMKTYSITPEAFGQKAREAAEAGAQVVYLVDSAGSMTPEDVNNYLVAAKGIEGLQLGFHGHDNLRLAVANSLEAFQSGATFADVTLFGLGRSAGNAASEVMTALLEKAGQTTGVDLYRLMDVAETYMGPLMEYHTNMDMTSVAMGFSQFHSGFLPKTAEAAREHKADLKRLVAAVGLHDPLRLEESALEKLASSLADTACRGPDPSLISFDAPLLQPQMLADPEKTLDELLRGLNVMASKRGGLVKGLLLKAHEKPAPELISADFIGADRTMALGVVTYGSLDKLQWVIDKAAGYLSLFFWDYSGPEWAEEAREFLESGPLKGGSVHPVDLKSLQKDYLLEVFEQAARRMGRQGLLLYGASGELALAVLARKSFQNIFWVRPAGEAPLEAPGLITLEESQDWQALNLKCSVAYCPIAPGQRAWERLERMLFPGGKVLCTDPRSGRLADIFIPVNLNRCLMGHLERLLGAAALFGHDRQA